MKKGLCIPFAASLLSLFLMSSPAWAGWSGKSHVVVNGKSYHFDSSYDWNENNFGFGIEHEFAQTSPWKKVVLANGFRDSTDNMSYMAGAGLHRRIVETDSLGGFYIYAGLNAFVMTRQDTGYDPFPGILPSVSVGNDKFGLNLTYLPRKAVEATTDSLVTDPTLSGILFMQFKVSLDQVMP